MICGYCRRRVEPRAIVGTKLGRPICSTCLLESMSVASDIKTNSYMRPASDHPTGSYAEKLEIDHKRSIKKFQERAKQRARRRARRRLAAAKG